MPRFAANLSMMFNEHPFLDRFDAAAKAGFKAVEFLFPFEYPAAELKRRLDANGLTQVLFNMPPGDWAAGERGLAVAARPPGAIPRRGKTGARLCHRARLQAGALHGRHRAGKACRRPQRPPCMPPTWPGRASRRWPPA